MSFGSFDDWLPGGWDSLHQAIETRKSPVETVRQHVSIALACEVALHVTLPPNEPARTLVAGLSEDENWPEKLGEIVSNPVGDLKRAGRCDGR